MITNAGIEALQTDSDASILTETQKQEMELEKQGQKTDVIDQLIDTPLWEGREYVSDDEQQIHITYEPFILDPTNSVEAAFIEIVKVFREADSVPEPVLIRNKELKLSTLKTVAGWIHPDTAHLINEIADDLGKLEEWQEPIDLKKHWFSAEEINEFNGSF